MDNNITQTKSSNFDVIEIFVKSIGFKWSITPHIAISLKLKKNIIVYTTEEVHKFIINVI